MQASEEHTGRILHRIGNHRAFGQLQIERRSDQIVGYLQEADRQRSELVDGQPAMPLVHRLGQA